HRDIKPQNMLILPETGELKIMDFGIARVSEVKAGAAGLTSTGTVMGTPDYMPPQQAQGHPAGFRSDIHSPGVVFSEIFTGLSRAYRARGAVGNGRPRGARDDQATGRPGVADGRPGGSGGLRGHLGRAGLPARLPDLPPLSGLLSIIDGMRRASLRAMLPQRRRRCATGAER